MAQKPNHLARVDRKANAINCRHIAVTTNQVVCQDHVFAPYFRINSVNAQCLKSVANLDGLERREVNLPMSTRLKNALRPSRFPCRFLSRRRTIPSSPDLIKFLSPPWSLPEPIQQTSSLMTCEIHQGMYRVIALIQCLGTTKIGQINNETTAHNDRAGSLQ